MKAIQPHERKIANIRDDAAYAPYDPEGLSETGTSFIRLNPKGAQDTGFYIYRMAPGARSTPHRHGGAEEFLIIEGELIDNDGTVYGTGDVVWLAEGALLHKTSDGRGSPFPGRTYPTASVTGMPSAV